MTTIHFIVNPIAGSANNILNAAFLNTHFNTPAYTIIVKHSNYKNHAIELTQDSIKEKADIIVACGGDGTINEVASCLVNTQVILGIIPTGSGNGLASNLKIPKKIEAAVNLIKKQNVKAIDVGKVNEKVFFSNTGIGFDAQVIKHYEASSNRKLLSYVKACIKSLISFKKTPKVTISVHGDILHLDPFLVFTSNSNEMGYNVSLTPQASLNDGLLDALIVPKMNLLKTLFFGFLILFKKQHILSEVKAYEIKEMTISIQDQEFFESQIDGDFHKINSSTIHISILENALLVIS
ncbi:MAG: diacylglycerol kinase family protein [Xanthomarina sp.]